MPPAPKAAPPKKEEPTAAAAPTEAAAPAKKVEKGKRPKKHKKETGVKAMYKVEGDKISRSRPTCERCGPGYFMADHHSRYTCGHCGFTRYKQK
ncbi:MAG TPA: 30S ribosomal protein S27ae [Candidatus Deferrimicrobiaceae bacterium]|nr:30S ribosomal protein S27ae [Candidatus Deferrimicrobiaceae bacterium]